MILLCDDEPSLAPAQNPAGRLLFTEALEMASDQRRQSRYPLFRPASIAVAGEDRQSIRAMIRDVSPTGIGLIHSVPIELGPATLSVADPDGSDLSLRLQFGYCKPCVGDWYLSGGSGSEPLTLQALRRLVADADKTATRRLAHRQSYFRPALIAYDGDRSETRGFTRDISSSGISLFHNVPLESGRVIVTVSALNGQELGLRVDVLWCRQCGNEWYISGGRLVPLVAEQLPSLRL